MNRRIRKYCLIYIGKGEGKWVRKYFGEIYNATVSLDYNFKAYSTKVSLHGFCQPIRMLQHVGIPYTHCLFAHHTSSRASYAMLAGPPIFSK